MHDLKQKLERYEKAKAHRQNFVDLFEECYEYALPQRESFYTKPQDSAEMIRSLMKLQ